MSDTEIADQVNRLRVKANMLRMGERIAFGSDSYALDCAADTIEKLIRERDEARQWERLHEVELSRTMLVLGHRFTLVPPDGGDVRPREAAKSAIDALAAAEARVAELEAALVKAHGGLKAGIAQYASRDFHGNEVAGDEQYPWIRAMQIGRDAARAALGKDKETSHEP